MIKFKVYFLLFFCIVITMALAGCGTITGAIKGIGNDIGLIGDVLKSV